MRRAGRAVADREPARGGRSPLAALTPEVDQRNELLAKLALFSHPAIWPSAQVVLVFHDAWNLPIGRVARLIGADQTRARQLLARGRRRIKAFALVGRVAPGRAWARQLDEIHQFVNRLVELAARCSRRAARRRLELLEAAHEVCVFLAEHPLAGTPASQELEQRVRGELESLSPPSPDWAKLRYGVR